MSVTRRAVIDRFLSCHRIALIGLSRDRANFSRRLFREFLDRGYDTIPVSPNLIEVEGRPCYSSVRDIVPGVDAALVMTSAAISEQIVRDCAAAGVQRVWLYRASGTGAVSDAALRACDEAGIEVVTGERP